MDVAPAIPDHFPVWCRAIYSWGGEGKRDLGFIEGDLIECLNAGDGQWWTGRLRRDKRAVGQFPSNFVKVLDKNFKPVSRGTSPLTTSAENTPPPKKEKSVFRKPFQAYSAVIPEAKKAEAPVVKPMRPISRGHERRGSGQREAKPARVHQLRDAPSRQDSGRSYVSDATNVNFSSRPVQRSSRENSLQQQAQSNNRRQSYQPYDDMPSRQNSYQQHTSDQDMPSRQNSYQQHDLYEDSLSRQHSYQQHQQYEDLPSRQNSYQQHTSHYNTAIQMQSRQQQYGSSSFEDPYQQQYSGYHSHDTSPQEPSPPPPPQHISRAPSPQPMAMQDDEPPPPPPPHRSAYGSQPSRAPSPAMNDRYPAVSRTPSPMPHSPHPGMTPSPLRDAMEDVLDSLQDMSTDMDQRQDDDVETPPENREPLNPWSPEAFEELRTNSRRKTASRAQTSMGLGTERPLMDDCNTTHDSGYSSQNSTDGWRERMENRLRENTRSQNGDGSNYSSSNDIGPPPPQRKYGPAVNRPTSSADNHPAASTSYADDLADARKKLRSRKSAYELGKEMIGRTFTTKSSSSNATESTNAQSNSSGASGHTLMSGQSAGAFSATSAGSYARRKLGSFRRQNRPMSVAGTRPDDLDASQMRPPSQVSGPSYHSSHASQNSAAARPVSAMERPAWTSSLVQSGDPLGGLTQATPSTINPPQLKSKRSGFLRKLVDSAKAGAATARSTIGSSPEKEMRRKSVLPNGVTAISSERSVAEEMGLGGGTDWMQFRRDVNRSNSLSAIERQERQERCDLMNQPVLSAVEALAESAEGDEGLDGMAVSSPIEFRVPMQLVDKTARFLKDLPPMASSTSLAQGYLCRPYRSDVQRLRAIFTWVSEKIAWEEDYDSDIDTRRVIHSRRGCPAEVAALVSEMCQAVGIHCEMVNGYLKPPGEVPDIDKVPRPNHWWNTVLVDGEWRIMDCSLASPTNPKRFQYSMASTARADPWYFLVRPLEACYTHIPAHMAEQHIVPPVSPDILMALPCACPPFFTHGISLVDYDTSLLFLSDLDVMQIDLSVPHDVEVHAEVETRGYARDPDGDTYESGENVIKRALAQPQWVNGTKRYTVKAVLPADEGFGKLRIFAGKRGLMHSIKDNPHSLALSLPIVHSGKNPLYDFFLRHPTAHAQRHDLYVAQPQCHKLAYGNTFVFAVRQHPSNIPGQGGSSVTASSPAFGRSTNGAISPLPFRPGSALSMTSSSASGSNFGPTAGSSTYSGSSSGAGPGGIEKPAKLAVQSPGGKILRMTRKPGDIDNGKFGGGTWEAYIKVSEKGTWRGLVLADRSARWCVFGEWECV